MGLLTGLVTLPLAPVRGVAWVAGKVAEAAEREHGDPALVRARLRELALLLESGRISEAEFDAAEEELLDRLERSQSGGR
ncbi:gas vesicle protein GvpG [Phytohabitans sp. ZYX-F-186]|uniref:Gas vesicle protein GvpG n=1 Tax=Phytohabitans maris TaxID=3071409 RepID=A0ABU0ZU06_9ACTN|nr:gas vesicle protein GvpG [Phytohabitans sp. ZYX-F-186]MDQ7910433.1 gas vesicle protein GvpG [Phytohabitans sp. ZYX-F-186]